MRKYFEDKMKEYKASEGSKLERLKALMRQILGKGYEPSFNECCEWGTGGF